MFSTRVESSEEWILMATLARGCFPATLATYTRNRVNVASAVVLALVGD